jgi:two-component system, NtrC family, sensor kinase
MEAGQHGVFPFDLPELLRDGEMWLMERVLTYARLHGYAAYTSTLVEPWRVSIDGLSRAITAAWATWDGSPHDYPVNTSPGGDPIAAFAIREAGQHRGRGVTLDMFWGLLKYYGRAYLDLVDARLPRGAEREEARTFVAECFARMEFAFVLTWTRLSGQEASDALARENRQLANEKNKYLTVFESIPHALFLLDADGRVENCNADALALAGVGGPTGKLYYTRQDNESDESCQTVLGRPLAEVLPWIAPVLTTGREDAGGWDVLDDEVAVAGEERRLSVSVHPLRDVSGRFAGRVVLGRDVTDARRAECALRQSEERYRTLVDLMHQGLVIFSPEGMIDFVNDTLCEMLGVSAHGMIGRDAMDFVRPEDRERFAAEQRARRDGVADPYEMGLRRRDGRLIQVMASPSPMIGPDGDFQGSLEVFTDVSHLRELEMRLTTAKRLEAIGQLAGGVAHEINTPLQYVSGNLDFAQANLPRVIDLLGKYEGALAKAADPRALASAKADIEAFRQEHDLEMVLPELPQALAECQAGAQRVAAFVRSIKRFAQSELVGSRDIDLAEAVATTVEVAKSVARDATEVGMDLAEDLPLLSCDPGDFNQLLLCLLLNAIQAVEEAKTAGKGAGQVLVTGRRRGGCLELAIGDTGLGIAPEIQEKIFNPFFTTKDVGKGAGQGLSIALSIVQKYRGSLRFETEPGRGTTFYVTFPLEP